MEKDGTWKMERSEKDNTDSYHSGEESIADTLSRVKADPIHHFER